MTTQDRTVSTSRTHSGLREVAQALQGAETALGRADDGATHEALVALARASYESLSSFERQAVPAPRQPYPLVERLQQWRRELDETRVQLALAEMEAREAGTEIAHRVEQVLGPAADRVTGAVQDIVGTLADVRRGLTQRS